MNKNNLEMFCLSLNPKHLSLINKLGYIPVGLGDLEFNEKWQTDKHQSGEDIFEKNKNYGEYTFHYKLWKHNLLPLNKWIGFCQYRKFWITKSIDNNPLTFEGLNKVVLKQIPSELLKYETIIGEDLFINQLRLSKFLKKIFKKIILNPSILIIKNKRNIKFHFDMMHGDGNLDKAINLLDTNEKNDFTDFVNTEISFNPHNMFICKNREIIIKYYNSLFPWLERCEKIFGLATLNTYGLKRIYGFLAERYMSYWFKKYTKFYLMKIHFKDLSDFI